MGASSSTISLPPLDGSLPVVPGFIDFHAQKNPEHPWVILAADSEGSSSTRVSFREYANATQRVAHHIRPGRVGRDGEVIAVLINCDAVLYLAVIAGIIRAGLVPFPISPRNTPQAIACMMSKTSCSRVLSQKTFGPVLSDVRAELEKEDVQLKVDDLPELHHVFPVLAGRKSDAMPYPPAPKPVDMSDIAFYIHSSGSSGPPKPIPQRHINMLHWCRTSVITVASEYDLIWGCMASPTFHTIGICGQLLVPLVTGRPAALYAARSPAPPVTPTPQNILAACKSTGASAIPAVPTFLEAWAQNDEDIKYLATLKLVTNGGGPLSDKSAQKLIDAGVKLSTVYGGTEFGVPSVVCDIDYSGRGDPAKVKTADDWAWMAFPDFVRWDPQGDGSYELQFLTCPSYQPNVENLTDTKGYATKDLFVPHPSKKGLWRITGRKDDVIVLSTGEKVVPIPQEGIITASPMISGAVMFGRARSQCGVLIEPSSEYPVDHNTPGALSAFRDTIWPIIQEANEAAPSFARIFKEMIVVTDTDRPLPRAAKGTVIRKLSVDLYSGEIDDLYNTASLTAEDEGIPPPLDWSPANIERWLTVQAASIHDGMAADVNIDIFDQGFDSLHSTFLRNRIVSTLRSSTDKRAQAAASVVPYTIIYDHPTLSALATTVSRLVSLESEQVAKDDVRGIADMIDKYSQGIRQPVYAAAQESSEMVTVLLTGSTGNLGSQILAVLLANPRTERVYTLNRLGPNSPDRQAKSFKEKGLPTSLLEQGKLVQVFGDFSRPDFGLDEKRWEEIKSSVTHIIHNAWRVDFNRALSSFESYVAGTRYLADVCAQCPLKPRLFFTSSVSSMQRWPSSLGPVPEEPGEDPALAATMGYAASKFATENVLAKAYQAGVPCTTLRIGQICGPKNSGAWDTSEWLPILFKSSIALGALPDLGSDVSWIPMDAVANVVQDLVLSQCNLPVLMNVVHPRPVPWRHVMDAFNANLGFDPLPVVPFTEWLNKLEEVAARADNEDSSNIPAISLLQVFRDLITPARASGADNVAAGPISSYDTSKLCQYSASVCSLEPIGEEHVEAWVRWWRQQGFIQQ